MHLSRGYPWKLDLADRELSVIEKCLSGETLTAEEDKLADHILFYIRNVRSKVLSRKRAPAVSTVTEVTTSGL